MQTTKKTFRLFISSTFSDMRTERDILQTKVFPQLRDFCRGHGADFQAIDLRWGVSEDTQIQQKTMRLCLGEIARCKKLSPKPNFLILLGDRYGWEPLPESIPSTEMASILGKVDGEERAHLDRWYREDLNAAPPEYVLLPRGGEFANFPRWEEETKVILAIIRQAVELLRFDEASRVKYYASATHQEIIKGVFSSSEAMPAPEEHVLACVRTLDTPDPQGSTGASRDRLEALKTGLQDFLPPEHCLDYRGSAASDGSSFTLNDGKAFADWALQQLTQLIEAQLKTVDVEDKREAAIHKAFQKRLCNRFVGRGRVLAEIAGYCASPGGKVLLLSGPGGSGKSSVMAEASRRVMGQGRSIVLRFVGLTSTATDPESLVRSVCMELAEKLGRRFEEFFEDKDDKEPRLDDPRTLRKLFEALLAAVPEDEPVTLFLDALDQIEGGMESTLASMLPTVLPATVAMVVSALPEWETALKDAKFVHLEAMPEAEGQVLLHLWLKDAGRTLQGEQETAVIDQFSVLGLPLYLRLVFEKARETRSFETLNFGGTIETALSAFFDGLEGEHGELLVRKVVSFLLAGRYVGLKEDEIVDLLAFDKEYWNYFVQSSHPAHRKELEHAGNLPVAIWSRLYLDLEPYMSERDAEGEPVLAFFHRQFAEYAAKRYGSSMEPAHDMLSRYFEAQPLYFDEAELQPNRRKAMEQAWQEMRAGRWNEQLAELSLGNFPFVMMKFKAELGEQAIREYRSIEKDAPLGIKTRMRIWSAFFREKAHILRRGNGEWPSYKILLQLAVEHADDSPVTIGAERWLEEGKCGWRWIRRTQRVDHAGESKVVATLEGHTAWICNVLELSDGRLASCSEDRTIRIWSAAGQPLIIIETGHNAPVSGVLERADGTLVSWSWRSDVRIWSRQGNLVRILERPNLRDTIKKQYGALALAFQVKNSDGRFQVATETERLFSATAAIDMDDGCLAICYKDKTLTIWSHDGDLIEFNNDLGKLPKIECYENKKSRRTEECTGRDGNGEIIRRDGLRVVWQENNVIMIIDPAQGGAQEEESHKFTGIPEIMRIGSFTMSRAGEELIVWNAKDVPISRLRSISEFTPFASKFDQDMFLIASPDQPRLEIRDFQGHLVNKIERSGTKVRLVGFQVRSDKTILAWYSDNMLIIWNNTGNQETTIQPWQNDEYMKKEFFLLKDGRFVTWEYKSLKIWSPKGEQIVVNFGFDTKWKTPDMPFIPAIDHDHTILGVAERSNGSIVSWDSSGLILIRDFNKASLEDAFQLPNIKGLKILSDDCILVWTWDGRFQLYGEGCVSEIPADEAILSRETRQGLFGSGSSGDYFWHSGEKVGVPGLFINSIGSKCFLANVFDDKVYTTAVWQALSPCAAYYLRKDGRMVATQDNGQVCFLRLYEGNQMITLDGTPT